MNALIYIIRKSAKNSFKELLKKPGKLVMYLVVIAAITGLIVLSFFTRKYVENPAPLFWFTGILFVFISLFVIISFAKGVSGGNTIFEMNDVNLLFVSPVSSRQILLYGIIRLAKASFLASFFVLFQSSSLANFGVYFGGVMLTFAGFLLSVMVLTIASLLIYCVTNGRPSRKRAAKCLAAVLFAPLVIFIAAQYISSGNIFFAVETAINSPFLRFVPVAGWTASGVTAFISGDIMGGFLFFGLNLLLGIGLTVYILLSNPDYYEDVLVATETAYEKKRAVADGNVNAAFASERKVKITKTGIPGRGASALFGKHMRENFRQSIFGFFPISSILFVAGSVIGAVFIRNLLAIIQILMWTQIFLIGTGRGLKETYSHYIYLIPESSFKKIIWSNMEIVARSLTESVLIFIACGFVVHAAPSMIIACILVYALFSFLLLGVNYLSMRFTGADISAGVLIMIYLFAVLLIMIPGIVLAVITGIAVGGEFGYAVGLLVLSGWELAAGLACFALSSGVLHNCDMPVMKTK